MWIIEFFKTFFKGRGFYPTLIVILSWTYAVILFIMLICQFILFIFKVKYCDSEFSNSIKKKSRSEKKT